MSDGYHFGNGMSLNEHKRQAVKAAEELHYDDEFVEEIRNAKTANEITRILANARKKKWDTDE